MNKLHCLNKKQRFTINSIYPILSLWECLLTRLIGPDSHEKINGEMAEWLKAHAWKACIRAIVSWVRIPLSPPKLLTLYCFIK